MTTYTLRTKEILRADIVFIDEQLEFARGKMAQGDKAEAWSTLDSLLGYFDFKKHFPDIFVNENDVIKFQDVYEALRGIDDIIEIDAIEMLSNGTALDWRPGYTRAQILQKLQEFLQQIDRWKALNWFEGEEIDDALSKLKSKVDAFINFYQNYNKGDFLFREALSVYEAKKLLWRTLSDDLPFAEIYEQLLSMDRNLTYLVFKFRLHNDQVTKDMVNDITQHIEDSKHAILAIVDATKAEDEVIEEESENKPFQQPPPGWDDLQPFPPYGYAMLGADSIVPLRVSRRRGSIPVINKGNSDNTISINQLSLLGIVAGAAALGAVGAMLFGGNC